MSTIKTFRTKPLAVEAIQWDGTEAGATPIIEWVNSNGGTAAYDRIAVSGSRYNNRYDERIYINTADGPATAGPNDWIVRNVMGKFYPCPPHTFVATHDEVSS